MHFSFSQCAPKIDLCDPAWCPGEGATDSLGHIRMGTASGPVTEHWEVLHFESKELATMAL